MLTAVAVVRSVVVASHVVSSVAWSAMVTLVLDRVVAKELASAGRRLLALKVPADRGWSSWVVRVVEHDHADRSPIASTPRQLALIQDLLHRVIVSHRI